MITTRPPFLDEARYLLLKVIEQAIRDYLALGSSASQTDNYYYQSACEFIFEDEYEITYGEERYNLQDLLELLGLEINWVREKVIRLKNKRINCLKEQRNKNDFEDDKQIIELLFCSGKQRKE